MFSIIHKKVIKVIYRLNTIQPTFRFLILLLTLALVYDYPGMLLKRPQSIHHWRQSDCASLALNYYQHGMHFFQPETHNLTSDKGTTGNVAPSEIPIGYYFIACLYWIFGYHDFIYRLLNTLIFLTGLFYLFKAFSLFLKSFFWSAFLTLLFFTSPVLVYYGNNFLTDSSALAFALIAWYFFLQYYKHGKETTYYISMFFFLLAGAFKITALISLAAILCLFLTEVVGIAKFRNGERLFRKPTIQGLPFVIIGAIIGGWVVYAKYYNAIHGTGYFSTGIFPVWELNEHGIKEVLKCVRIHWVNQYFLPATLYVFGAVFLFNLVFFSKQSKLLITSLLFIFVGTILYILLWFQTFQNHDYYTLNLYILLIINGITFAWLVNKHFEKNFNLIYVKIAFFVFFVVNVVHAQKQMHFRYYGWPSEYPSYKDYHTITPYLRSLGISKDDTVVCLPDDTHFTLYLMNQKGWTHCYSLNYDSVSVAKSISKGAKYLIINGNEMLGRDYIQGFLYHPIGEYGLVHIFKLDNQKQLQTIEGKKYERIVCGAEKVTLNSRFFIADSSTAFFENGYCQSEDKHYSGKYSACLSEGRQYAMTYRFRNVKAKEHYIISVVRWSESGMGTIVASANDLSEFYLFSPTIEKLKDGWDRLTLDFTINFKPKDGQLAIYLWNPGKTPVYFDEFTLQRYY
jgi:hypothetical protein